MVIPACDAEWLVPEIQGGPPVQLDHDLRCGLGRENRRLDSMLLCVSPEFAPMYPAARGSDIVGTKGFISLFASRHDSAMRYNHCHPLTCYTFSPCPDTPELAVMTYPTMKESN